MPDMIAKAPFEKRLASILRPAAEAEGFRLVRLRYLTGSKPTLQVMAERPDGRMEIEDCATLSRALSAALDVEDPIAAEYALEVSSPGHRPPADPARGFRPLGGLGGEARDRGADRGAPALQGHPRGVEGTEVLIEIEEGVIGLDFDWLADAGSC